MKTKDPRGRNTVKWKDWKSAEPVATIFGGARSDYALLFGGVVRLRSAKGDVKKKYSEGGVGRHPREFPVLKTLELAMWLQANNANLNQIARLSINKGCMH